MMHVNGHDVAEEHYEPSPCHPHTQQVYACTGCGEQGWLLLEGGGIACSGCGADNAAQLHQPVRGTLRPMPKLRFSREAEMEVLVCPRCQFRAFHLHESGTITCFRCRHSVGHAHYMAEDEV